MDATQKQINQIIVKLESINNDLKKTTKAEIANAAKPVLSNLQANTPVGSKTHKRYSRGSVVATYKPGNLKKSIKILRFQRSKTAVFVGPAVGKKTQNDGYYARFVNFGTKYMAANRFIERGLSSAMNQSLKIMTSILSTKTGKL
jgi:HK97 gp10 family phage protein